MRRIEEGEQRNGQIRLTRVEFRSRDNIFGSKRQRIFGLVGADGEIGVGHLSMDHLIWV